MITRPLSLRSTMLNTRSSPTSATADVLLLASERERQRGGKLPSPCRLEPPTEILPRRDRFSQLFHPSQRSPTVRVLSHGKSFSTLQTHFPNRFLRLVTISLFSYRAPLPLAVAFYPTPVKLNHAFIVPEDEISLCSLPFMRRS